MSAVVPYEVTHVLVERDEPDIERYVLEGEAHVWITFSRRLHSEEVRQIKTAFEGIGAHGDYLTGFRVSGKQLDFWAIGESRVNEFVKRVSEAADQLAEATTTALNKAEYTLKKLEAGLQKYVAD